MSKIKLPKPYISFSQFWLFNQSPMEYYEQYFVGRVDKATPKMIFGKIFQEAWCDRKYDYAKALKEGGFTSDKNRVIKEALLSKEATGLPKSKTEKRIMIKHPDIIGGYKILAILDGLDLDKGMIVENKMGVWWTQKMADESEQLTIQALVCYIRYGKILKIKLQSYNSNNGIPRIFWTKRTEQDFNNIIERINSMITRIEAGDFEKY